MNEPEWYQDFLAWWDQYVTNAPDPRTAQANAARGQDLFNQRMAQDEKNKDRKSAESQQDKNAILGVGSALAAPALWYGGKEIASLFGLGEQAVAQGATQAGAQATAGAGSSALATGGGGSGGGAGGGGAAASQGGYGWVGPAVAAATMGYEINDIARSAGNKWAEEGEHKRNLKKKGITLLDEAELQDDYWKNRGFDNEHFVDPNSAPDFVGDVNGKHVNNRFWNSAIAGEADEGLLTGRDTQGAATWADRYGSAWAEASPEQRAKIVDFALRNGLVNRGVGRFQLQGGRDSLAELDEFAASQGIGRFEPHAKRDEARRKMQERWADSDTSPNRFRTTSGEIVVGELGKRDAHRDNWAGERASSFAANNPENLTPPSLPGSSTPIMDMGGTVPPPPPPQLPNQFSVSGLPPGTAKLLNVGGPGYIPDPSRPGHFIRRF